MISTKPLFYISKYILGLITTKAFLFLFLFIIVKNSNGQVNYAFVKHLSESHLVKEHLSYISQLSEGVSADSVNYLKAKYYLQYPNDSLFLDSYFKSGLLFKNDSNAFVNASIHFLRSNKLLQEIWYNSFLGTTNKRAQLVNSCYVAVVSPTKIDENTLPVKLQSDFHKYKKSQSKKPWVAGVLSAAVPGLGKMYAGRRSSSYFTFFSHVAYGLQSYECVKKLGVSHPFSIFSLSLFSVFYIANIYGSIQAVTKVKEERKTQFLINAEQYYHFNFGTPLY